MRYNWLVCAPLNYLYSNETFVNAIKVHPVVLQRIARVCSKVRAARAARLFFLIEPIKFLIFDAVVAVRTKASLFKETASASIRHLSNGKGIHVKLFVLFDLRSFS